MRRASTNQKSRRGATLVESAIAMGVLFVCLLAIFEFSRAVMACHLLENAARAGARQAVVEVQENRSDTAPIEQAIRNLLVGQIDNPRIEIYRADQQDGSYAGPWQDAGFDDSIIVRISAQYRPLVPTFGILPDPVPLEATSAMRSEGN